MKQGSILIGIFLVGIGVGWFSRGSVGLAPAVSKAAPVETASKAMVVSQNATSATADEKPSNVPGKRVIREETPKKSSFMPDSSEMKSMQEKVTKAMAERQRAKYEQYIGRLTETLSLTDVQKTGLTKWLDERLSQLESLDFSNPGSLAGKTDALTGLTTQAMDAELAKSLTAEQKLAFDGFKEKDTQSKVDAMALKNLSQLQGVVNFEDGQRDEVYKILSTAAAEKLSKQSANEDPSRLFTEGMGIDMDPYDLGLQDAMTESMKGIVGDGQQMDHKSMAENLRKVIDDRINAKVELLRPVLNEQQLERYRTELKNKGTGFLGNAVLGLEASDGAVK